jgi:drug/metabolite transporter (DMT)-like permease
MSAWARGRGDRRRRLRRRERHPHPRHALDRERPHDLFLLCLVGLPVVLPFAGGQWPASPFLWMEAVAVGLAAFAGQVLMADAYGALSVAEAATWLQLTPIAQMVLAAPILGEPIEPVALAGILLTVAAVAYGTVLGVPRPIPPSPAPPA